MANDTRDGAAPARASGTTAVLDEAHIGDIRGALGTISQHDVGARKGWGARLLTLAAIIGPGIIVMVGDNDAGGVATYSQAGQNYGNSLLWVLPLLIPVLVVNQEMVVRLGAVTGVGHARLIKERFGRFWGMFSVGDLLVLDFLTIVTEFIGVDLALGYFGVSKYISVPIAAAALVVMTATGSFRRWERFMLLFVVANFLVIPLAIFSHPHLGPVLHGLTVPGIAGGANSTSVLLIISIVGTTVAPWQLFFQQSNIVDKRITPRWINYERADTVLGSFVTVIGAIAMVVTCAFAFAHSHYFGNFTNAGGVAQGLEHQLGHAAGHPLRARAPERVDHRGGDGNPRDFLCRRGLLRGAPFPPSELLRREGLLCELRRAGRGGGRHRPYPACPPRVDHVGRASFGRRPAAFGGCVLVVALQRPRRPRAVGEPALAQRRSVLDHWRVARHVAGPRSYHGLPERKCRGPVPRAGRRLIGRTRRRYGVGRAAQAGAASGPAGRRASRSPGELAYAAPCSAWEAFVVPRPPCRHVGAPRLPGRSCRVARREGRAARQLIGRVLYARSQCQ